jgi:hypothetical protein
MKLVASTLVVIYEYIAAVLVPLWIHIPLTGMDYKYERAELEPAYVDQSKLN